MFTFRLWSALHRPYVAHPLYRHLTQQATTTKPLPGQLRDLLPDDSAWGSIILVLSLVAIAVGGYRVLLLLLFFIPLGLIAVGTFSGLLALWKTNSLVIRQTEQGKHELIAVTPAGLPGMMWALCSFAYHQGGLLRAVKETMRGVYIFGFFILIAPAFFLLIYTIMEVLTANSSSAYSELTQTLIASFSLLSLAYLDLVQSILVGSVLGMLIPTYTRNRIDSGGLALGAFFAVQFLAYALIALLDLVFLPQLAAQATVINGSLLIMLQVFVFFMVRETTLILLWRMLTRRIEATPAELYQITGM